MKLLELFGGNKTFSPHDFAISDQVKNSGERRKVLGLTHNVRVTTVYPDGLDGHHYPAPAVKHINKALASLKKEVAKKLHSN